MKIIYNICKNELRNLFYSPVAWFLAIVFFIQCAYFYIVAVHQGAIFQEQMLLNAPRWKDFGFSITIGVFLSDDGVIPNVYRNLFLFVPLITMGLLSREVNSGSVKLLYSSPIKLRQIVLGKYLAIMAYNLFLLSLLTFFMISAAFNIEHVDYGLLASALFGFYLLICTYSAIGLFMSSLTTYQIVSGIGTFTVIFILSRIGSLWQRFDFVRDMTYFLSIAGRGEKMLKGLIISRDVIYFLIVTLMFLGFTLLRLKGEKESTSFNIKAMRYTAIVFLSLMIGYITSRPFLTGYWDTTAAKINTIDPEAQTILRQMNGGPLEITLYTNLFGNGLERARPDARNSYLNDFWDKYQRFKPNIKFKYVYYYDDDGRLNDHYLTKTFPHKSEKQMVGIFAKTNDIDSSLFIEPQQIRKQIDPYAENQRVFMEAKFKNRIVHLRTYDDGDFWPDQAEVASKLKRLVTGDKMKVYYISGDLERDIYKRGEREYSGHSVEKSSRESLINLGFDPDTLSLENREIPPDAQELILSDPKTNLGTRSLERLTRYISRGGNILIFGEPGKQAILNPLLQRLGVKLMDGQLVQLNKEETPDKITPAIDSAFGNLSNSNFSNTIRKEAKDKFITEKRNAVLAGATAIKYSESTAFTITPLMSTYKTETWLKMGRLVTDSVPPEFSPNDGDFRQQSFVTAASLTRKIAGKEQRIAVFGDADIFSNIRVNQNGFFNTFFNWMNYGKYPVYIRKPMFMDTRLIVSSKTAYALKIVYIWILPAMLLLAGMVILIRRKRK